MSKRVNIYLLALLFAYSPSMAQVSFEQKVLDTLSAHPSKNIVFKKMRLTLHENKLGCSQKTKVGLNSLYFYNSIPNRTGATKASYNLRDTALMNFLNNGGENDIYPRGIVYKGKFFSIDSGVIDSDNYLMGAWLDLSRCLSYKSGDYQYSFSQWYLHFTNGSHPPSLITILIFKKGNFLGALNYISDDENFEDFD